MYRGTVTIIRFVFPTSIREPIIATYSAAKLDSSTAYNRVSQMLKGLQVVNEVNDLHTFAEEAEDGQNISSP